MVLRLHNVLLPLIIIVIYNKYMDGASVNTHNNDVNCPESCKCIVAGSVKCKSYEMFITQLQPKQKYAIHHLDLSNSTIGMKMLKTIDVYKLLKSLNSLETLDLSMNKDHIQLSTDMFPSTISKLRALNLSGNGIDHVKFSQLPQSLEHLDLTQNLLNRLPTDWRKLQRLKRLHLNGNPIECDCDTVLIYEDLIRHHLINPIERNTLFCHYPMEFYGHPLVTMNCSFLNEYLLNTMLADETGSGDDNSFEEEYDYEDNLVPLVDEHNDYDLNGTVLHTTTADIEITTMVSTVNDDDLMEGSGFEEDSSDFPPQPCHINCSTPKPVGSDDEVNASPLPSLKEQFNILFSDIFGSFQKTTTTTTTAKPTLKPTTESTTEIHIFTEITTTTPIIETDDNITSSPITVINNSDLISTRNNMTEIVNDMEKASFYSSTSYFSAIFITVIVTLVIFITIYYVVCTRRRRNRKTFNKRSKRHRNQMDGNNTNVKGEELKPLSHKSAGPLLTIANSDAVPNLDNGANETSVLLNTTNGKLTENGSGDINSITIEVPKPVNNSTLNNQPEKVTIRVGDLPDSIPKTPLLVHRQSNRDGEITTTIYS